MTRKTEYLVPRTDEEVARCLADPEWRLFSGHLYKIQIKGDKGEDALVMPFRPNRAQRKFIRRLWHRNIILKARQLGFTTLVAILWLDTALFVENVRCGLIAQDLPTAKSIFRDKVLFAYKNLPDGLREMMPLLKQSAEELHFGHNNSSIRVATSLRGGTYHRVHVSEYGKICAKYPEKAVEIQTGSVPSVPSTGILIFESTAEGRDGDFYAKSMQAKALHDASKTLTARDYRFHFYPWWQEPGYQMPPEGVIVTDKDRKYFEAVEAKTGTALTDRQRAWYVATRDADFSGAEEKMWQEFPSCIAGDVLVGTPNGIMPIRDVIADGDVILAHMHKGTRPVFNVRTRLGYTVRCTDDHPIKTQDGTFRKISEGLGVGDRVALSSPQLSQIVQSVKWNPVPFVDGQIEISEGFAEFLGIFMGDGSFYNGTVSVACDAADEDIVAAVESMFDRYLGGSASRVVGEKQGCIEVRKSSVGFADPMMALGIVERRESGGLKRKVHVPPYIFRSPKPVVAAFLRGLFEADGFAARDGTSIKFFSKHQHVVQDVQLLLLALGIESRASSLTKKSGAYEYTGHELVLRASGVRKFAAEVGFISDRKQSRANLSLGKRKSGSAAVFDCTDEIVSVTPDGEAEVFDITTATHEFDAGGIVVHNCAEEAFQVSTEGCYFVDQLTLARKQDRITTVPLLPNVPCNTFWDIGSSDGCAVWVHQRVGLQNNFVRFKEGWGEAYSYYVQWLLSLGVIFHKHYLPHDADHVRQGKTRNESPRQMLEQLLPGHSFVTVDRIQDINWGIQQARDAFAGCWFDEEHCKPGLIHLESYRKKWNDRQACWSDEPDKAGGHSEAADAFRQFAQGYQPDKPSFLQKRRGSANWRRT